MEILMYALAAFGALYFGALVLGGITGFISGTRTRKQMERDGTL